jgi:hypothetical protein
MTWFTEDSTFPMVTGAIMVIILLAMAFSAREKRLFQLAIVIGILTAATVICENLIVTDQEQVKETVYQLSDRVQANDVRGVLGFVGKQRQDTRQKVENEMPRYDFDTCRIIGFNYFEPDNDGSAKTAEICFVVAVRVRIDGGPEPLPGQRKVTLKFEKEPDGKWRVIDYWHEAPQAGLGL